MSDEATHHQWTHAQLDPTLRSIVAAWPYVMSEMIAGLHVAFLHYPRDTASSGFVPILSDPSNEDLDRLFGNQRAGVIFYGHHHPTATHHGRRLYVNPGALGCGRDPLARFV